MYLIQNRFSLFNMIPLDCFCVNSMGSRDVAIVLMRSKDLHVRSIARQQ